LILVTHAHDDHLGDTVEIAKRTGAKVLVTSEIADYLSAKGVEVEEGHIGGTFEFPFGIVKIFPAVHGSSTKEGTLGIACSFIIKIDGSVLYHAGDTALFGDMRLISEEFDIDVAMLPIGGRYTMGVDDAVRAEKFLMARTVIPMHYNTWEGIVADPRDFCRKVKETVGKGCAVLGPGETLEV